MKALRETENMFTTASRLGIKESTAYAMLRRVRQKADRGWNLNNYIQLTKRQHPRLRKLLTTTGRMIQE